MQTLKLIFDISTADVLRWLDLPGRWVQRHYQRCDLADLDDHLLADVGLTRQQAEDECAKPFWQR